jgi:hypothetical protein
MVTEDEQAPAASTTDVEGAVRNVLGTVWDVGRGGARKGKEALAGAIDALLDRITNSVISEPLDVRSARDAHRRIDDVSSSIGSAATAVGAPWVLNRVLRFARRGKLVPSAAVIAAAGTTLTAVTAGVQHLRVLASFLVQRLRAGGHRVDPAFVRRVAVATYLNPSVGTDAVRPNRTSGVRLATDWGTHAVPIVGSRKTASRVHRAADAIARLDLQDALNRFERDRAIDLRETTRSD